jgi:hypothetical protein
MSNSAKIAQRAKNVKVYFKTLADDQEALAIIKDISPIAWQHINLFGTFEFSPSAANVDIDALGVRYADPTYWHKAIQNETESNLD